MAEGSGTKERASGASATSDDAGAATTADGNGRGNSGSGLAGFRLPWPQGLDVNPTRLLWWGGLAALAAIEIIEWPVALAVGAGSLVAERMAHQDAEKIAAQRS